MDNVKYKKQLKRIRVTREFATALFQGDMGIVAGLPNDVTIDNIYEEPARDEVVFVLHSEEFDTVPEGIEIPIVEGVAASIPFDDPIT